MFQQSVAAGDSSVTGDGGDDRGPTLKIWLLLVERSRLNSCCTVTREVLLFFLILWYKICHWGDTLSKKIQLCTLFSLKRFILVPFEREPPQFLYYSCMYSMCPWVYIHFKKWFWIIGVCFMRKHYFSLSASKFQV